MEELEEKIFELVVQYNDMGGLWVTENIMSLIDENENKNRLANEVQATKDSD